jgi:prenylcysteine alpha-carboxyl methylesterase
MRDTELVAPSTLETQGIQIIDLLDSECDSDSDDSVFTPPILSPQSSVSGSSELFTFQQSASIDKTESRIYCALIWTFKLIRMLLFIILLLPGFLKVAIKFIQAKRSNIKSFKYGDSQRNVLDVYLPKDKDKSSCPVVIFVSGGGWVIGYKCWGALMGMVLAEYGIIAVIPDYRNFPQTDIDGMIDDISSAIQWTFDSIERLKGDKKSIYLVGQSAGAHISALSLLHSAISHKTRSSNKLAWKSSDLKGFIGISGPYNLHSLSEHLNKRGIQFNHVLNKIMKGNLSQFSPSSVEHAFHLASSRHELPPCHLFHGTKDRAVPHHISIEFAEKLEKLFKTTCTLKLYEGKTHTDLILEDPLSGKDPLLHDIISLIHEESISFEQFSRKPLNPRPCISLARWINPF